MNADVKNEHTEGWISWRALKSSAGRPTLWLATWSVLSIMALAVALPWQSWFEGATAKRYAPGELLRSLPATFRFDHASELSQLGAHTAQSGAVLALGAILLGIFAAGGWLRIWLEADEGPRLRRFLTGGAHYFWRFLRVWFISMVVLAVWRWVLYGKPWDELVLSRWLRIPKDDYNALETLSSESHVVALGLARDTLFWIGFALVLTCGVYARTRMAMLKRFSAFSAMLASSGTILRRPIRTLRPMFGLFLYEILFVTVGLGWAVRGIGTQLGEDSSWLVLFALFAVGQLAVMLRELGRGAKYAASVEVLGGILPAAGAEGEEHEGLGGPGGPQYPIDEDLPATGEGFGATV